MSDFERAARAATADLEATGLRFALVGGFAVSVRAEPRFTRDLDLAVAVESDEQAEDAVRVLLARGYAMRASVEHDVAHRLATVRLASPVAGYLIDLLFASSGIEPEVVRDAETIEVLPGLVLPVAAVGHLLVLKLLARDDERRPQDAADLVSLCSVADSGEFQRAREAAQAVVARGYGRGRDLIALLDELLPPA